MRAARCAPDKRSPRVLRLFTFSLVPHGSWPEIPRPRGEVLPLGKALPEGAMVDKMCCRLSAERALPIMVIV